MARPACRRATPQNGVELVAVARACGFKETFDIIDERGLREFAAAAPEIGDHAVRRDCDPADEPPRVLPPRDGVFLKNRFRRAIGAKLDLATPAPGVTSALGFTAIKGTSFVSIGTLPLSRFTVLDLTHARAGPTAVRQLADWGANVIKIEPPGEARSDVTGSRRDGFDFQNLHRNKRSLTLNLKTEEGKGSF